MQNLSYQSSSIFYSTADVEEEIACRGGLKKEYEEDEGRRPEEGEVQGCQWEKAQKCLHWRVRVATSYCWKLAFGLQNLVCGHHFNFFVTISLTLMAVGGTPSHEFSSKSDLPTDLLYHIYVLLTSLC